LITPIFIHFGLLHILFNSLWLWELGGAIERTSQAWKLGVLVLVIGLLSNLAQYFYAGPYFGGMSGVVYGLLGYVWAQGRFNPAARLVLNQSVMAMMMIWFVLCWTGWLGPVANMAHSAGLLAGLLWGWLEAQGSKRKRF
jgi:membrane associated rhomboid family serine protease